mmetsp:Transcript_42852/g.100487  ORF Transcript_42852/g.100487 Transcript_42852/m.100487 type:complete len:201 (-) Transcript_42852:266-868(-)
MAICPCPFNFPGTNICHWNVSLAKQPLHRSFLILIVNAGHSEAKRTAECLGFAVVSQSWIHHHCDLRVSEGLHSPLPAGDVAAQPSAHRSVPFCSMTAIGHGVKLKVERELRITLDMATLWSFRPRLTCYFIALQGTIMKVGCQCRSTFLECLDRDCRGIAASVSTPILSDVTIPLENIVWVASHRRFLILHLWLNSFTE